MNASRKRASHRTASIGMTVVAALTSATLAGGPSASATPAGADTSMGIASSSEEVAILGGVWQRDYYRNYFDELARCGLYGKALLAEPGRKNSGLRAIDCHKHAGESRWSMDIYWVT